MRREMQNSLSPMVVSLLLVVVALINGQCQAQDLSGRWMGRWLSETNGHQGRLNGTFVQPNACQLEARFTGTFAKVLPFRYRTKLDIVHQQPGLTIVSGTKKLGPILGEFRYYGELTDCQFSASYASRRNRGSWVMQR